MVLQLYLYGAISYLCDVMTNIPYCSVKVDPSNRFLRENSSSLLPKSILCLVPWLVFINCSSQEEALLATHLL